MQDDALLTNFSVKGKAPKLAVVINETQQATILNVDPQYWMFESIAKLTPFHKVLSEHMNGKGIKAKIANPIIGAIVAHDMKHLY